MKATDVQKELSDLSDPEKAAFFPRFFKAGPEQYGEGDKFLGVSVPQQRKIANQFKDLGLDEIEKLTTSPWHEERLTSLFILVSKYKRADDKTKKQIYGYYISHTKWINNWDLVDSSAEYIVGPWLDKRPEKMKVLTTLANSKLIWDRRIAMLSTFHYIKQSRADEALIISEQLLHDSHDLIQKAVGWMLREIGKRVDQTLLISFLEKHAYNMPRTTLRYAIEHLSPDKRKYFMSLKSK